jgi:hypothetical protein
MSKIAASNSRPGTAVLLAEEETVFSEAVTRVRKKRSEGEKAAAQGGTTRSWGVPPYTAACHTDDPEAAPAP